jgi:O-antigen/teichoic acid export membrane protein
VLLTGGRLLARNTLWSLAGQTAPLLVALFAIPRLVAGLGTDRFGVLTLSWALVGYFSLFDLGLGRALTQVVAGQIGREQQRDVPALIGTSMLAMLSFGCLGGIALGLLSPLIVEKLLRVPEQLEVETLHAFYLLAVALPFVVGTAGLAGLLAAYQRFALVNAIRIPLSIYSFAAPLLVLPFSHQISHVVAVLAGGRVLGWIAYAVVCIRTIPAARDGLVFDRSLVAPLIRSGGWMTASNVVSPLMTYLDRFLIGAWVSLSAVAWYTTSYELATKLWLIAGPVAGVLFPAFATSFAHDRDRVRLLFFRGVKYLMLIVFPVVLSMVTLAREGLTLWLDADFASHSAFSLQILSIAVFINCLAQIPFALIQGAGRPDLTALLHLIELPLYLAALWWLTRSFGIDGAAIAWLARVLLDTSLLFVFSQPFLGPRAGLALRVTLPSALAVVVFAVALSAHNTSLAMRLPVLVAVLAAFAFAAWFWGLRPERKALRMGSSARGTRPA